jgi:hypothetical protein
MTARRSLVRLSIVLSALAVLAAACATTGSPAGATREAKGGHPDAGAATATEACATCHEGATPAVVTEWNGGAHGLNLVRCFVCHGSAGEDFTAAPATERCAGCHARQVEQVAARPEGAACFSCHAPHSLSADGKPNPHRS